MDVRGGVLCRIEMLREDGRARIRPNAMAGLTRSRGRGIMRNVLNSLNIADGGIMVVRRYNESDIDFEAIDTDLAKLAPPKLTLKDVLDRLRERMLEQRARGVTVAQMHEVLKARGIELGERSLKTFLDKGELSGRKAAKVAAQIGGEASEGDAF